MKTKKTRAQTTGNRQKISISLSEKATTWADARKEAFGGKFSQYIEYLVLKEEAESKGGRDVFYHFRQAVDKELSAATKGLDLKRPDGGVDFVVGNVGIETKLKYTPGDSLIRMIAHVTSAIVNHKLEHVVIVMPDDAVDTDMLNFEVLRGQGAFNHLEVCRLKDLKTIVQSLLKR